MRNVSHARKLHQNTAVQKGDDDYEMDMDAQQAALASHVEGTRLSGGSVRARRASAQSPSDIELTVSLDSLLAGK